MENLRFHRDSEKVQKLKWLYPRLPLPIGFVMRSRLVPIQKLLLLIPLLWEKKLKLKPGQYFYFNSSSSFKKWFAQTGQFEDSLLFLFDYQFDSDGNGISLISEFGIQRESILITFAYNEE